MKYFIACLIFTEAFFFILNRLEGPVNFGRRWHRPYSIEVDQEKHSSYKDSLLEKASSLPVNLDKMKLVKSSFSKRGGPAKLNFDTIYKIPHFWASQPLRLGMNVNGRSVLAKADTGEVVWDVEVKTDEFGRRITPNRNQKKRNQHLALFGCNIVFGQGNNPNETLGAELGRLNPHYQIFNYGVPHVGPADILARLQDIDLNSELKQSSGKFIYFFLLDHVARMTPGFLHNVAFKNSPYFIEQQDQTLKRTRSFTSEYPLQSLFYDLLGYSETLLHYWISIPVRLTDEDFRKTARLVKEMKDTYKAKTGSDEFYVVIWPKNNSEAFAHFLAEYHIKYLDYGKFDLDLYIKGSPYQNPWTTDSSPELNKFLAGQITKDLHLTEN